MTVVGVSFKERAVCSECGATYDDKESIELVKKWSASGYAPCPNISCKGELKIELEITQV